MTEPTFDDALVEAAARGLFESHIKVHGLDKVLVWDTPGDASTAYWLDQARAVLAVAVPLIEARERERMNRETVSFSITYNSMECAAERIAYLEQAVADFAATIRRAPQDEGERG